MLVAPISSVLVPVCTFQITCVGIHYASCMKLGSLYEAHEGLFLQVGIVHTQEKCAARL